MGLSAEQPECPHRVVTGFPGDRDPRDRGRSCNAFCDLASKFIHCHFHQFHLSPRARPESIFKGTSKDVNTRMWGQGRWGRGPLWAAVENDYHIQKVGLQFRFLSWQKPCTSPCCISQANSLNSGVFLKGTLPGVDKLIILRMS